MYKYHKVTADELHVRKDLEFSDFKESKIPSELRRSVMLAVVAEAGNTWSR